MGCASSGPLVEQGKLFVDGVKDAASETVTKGEKALHNTTDTIKEGVTSGIDTVKETVQSAINTAEESVGSVTQKIGETFNFTSSKTSESLANELEETKKTLSSTKDDIVGNVSESAAEVVSDAETVIVSETEHAREAFQSGTSPLFETVHSMDEDMAKALRDLENQGLDNFHEKTKEIEESMQHTMQTGMEVLEDLEGDTKDHWGETVKKVDKKVEELMEDGHTMKIQEMEVEVESKSRPEKEDLQPTFWEAAADAILMRKTIKHLEPLDFGKERIFFPPPEKSDVNKLSEKVNMKQTDIIIENTE